LHTGCGAFEPGRSSQGIWHSFDKYAKLCAMSTTTKPEPVKLQVIIDLETSGETHAEELGWLLNLIRYELTHAPNWKGKIRRVVV
jgi:hypothetical protein